MELTPQHYVFVDAYVGDWNASKAASEAGFHPTSGTKLLANYRIKRAIQAKIDETKELAALPGQAETLRRLRDIAWADASELAAHRVTCCRHCHGIGHNYQWRSESEWARAIETAISEHETKLARMKAGDPLPKLNLPAADGGFDYDPHLLPIEACPMCDGDGVRTVLIADTRLLKGRARALYAGVKQTKDGIEVKMHDQIAAMTLYMRGMGMLNDKLTVITPGGGGVLTYTLEEAKVLTNDELDALETAHAKLTAQAAARKLEAPKQSGDIIDV